MTQGIKTNQSQIEGVRHSSSKMRRLRRAEDVTNGLWVPTPFRMTNLGWKAFIPFMIAFVLASIIGAIIP